MQNPYHSGNYWALWWGISLGLGFLAAATISLSMDGRGMQIASTVSYAVHNQEPVPK
jgi:hypothetical protein